MRGRGRKGEKRRVHHIKWGVKKLGDGMGLDQRGLKQKGIVKGKSITYGKPRSLSVKKLLEVSCKTMSRKTSKISKKKKRRQGGREGGLRGEKEEGKRCTAKMKGERQWARGDQSDVESLEVRRGSARATNK